MNYMATIDPKIKEYFNILEASFPEWLNEYINTPVLLHQQYISMTCGTIYSDLFPSKFLYSSLAHSIGVALIIWHFTHNKNETLSGLFHDIATPVFKHCIDFLNGDYLLQESTEDLTSEIIKNSPEIRELLKRDNIKLEEVNNYHLYPIADNDTPRLSADRLEYTLSNALLTYNLCNIKEIKKIYDDIVIGKDETCIQELSFKTKSIAYEFMKLNTQLSIIYRDDKTRYSMQFLADIIKKLSEEEIITVNDLYNMKEKDILNIIKRSQYKNAFLSWQKAKKVFVSRSIPTGVYYVHLSSKIRYVDPLVNGQRMSKISKRAQKIIANNFAYDMSNYVYLNFNFKKGGINYEYKI